MPEALIFAAAELIEVAALEAGFEGGAIALAEGTTFAGTAFAVSNVTLIQGGLALGASIGLAYVAAQHELPKPAEGSQSVRQALPARQRGYWLNRLAGATVLFEASAGFTAFTVQAFHQGKVEAVTKIFVDDIAVATTPDFSLTNGFGVFSINPPGGTMFVLTQVECRQGLVPQGASTLIGSATFKGNGIAYIAMEATRATDAETHQTMYPRGLPRTSVVAKCAPIWDPRDGAQSRFDASTWKASANPVLQLIDYLTLADGGLGYDLDEILPAARLAEWMVQANLCDVDLGGGNIRYRSAGWYKFDNPPEGVINHILSTCDGWLSDAGDGTLTLQVGVYSAPTEDPLTDQHVLDFALNYGMADESVVNQVNVSWVDPAQDYIEVEATPIQDATSIAETGVIRSSPLDLTWVQWSAQATRLAQRALLRLNPRRSGKLTTTLAGLRYLGRRWVRLQYPYVSDLADCVIEIQGADVDLLGGTIAFSWILVDPTALAAL